MKRIAAYTLLGTLLIVGLVIVATRLYVSPTPTASTATDSDIRIGFALGDLREERWQKDRDLFVKEAEKLGAYVQVTSANSNSDLQVSQVENLISQGVDVLVIVPYDGEKIASTVELAHKANIKVIAYDRLIKNSDLDFYVTFDNTLVGEMEAEAITAIQSKGNFAYIGGAPTDNNAALLKQGSMNILSPYIKDGSIKIVVDEFMTDWKPEEAYKTIRQYLSTGGKLDAIVAANDGTAFGAIRALKEFNLDGKVPVSGQDAELSACQRVVEGTQTVTVYKPISAIAAKAAQIAVTLARGDQAISNNTTSNGKINVPSYYLDPIKVTKENMDETVIKDGFHARDQVYQTSKK